MLYAMLSFLLYGFLPGNCLLCGSPSRRAMDLCESCEQDLPWNVHACAGCALPLPDSVMGLCDRCRNRQLAFDGVCAPFLYQDEISRLLTRAKSNTGLTGLALVSELCATRFSLERERPDALIPVPLSWQRMVARGFNQAALIARHYDRRLGIPVRHDVLRRRRHTPKQSGLSRRARLRNLVGAFEARGNLSGQSVALVDDVLTTGATALASSKALRKAGAKSVVVWVCARTPEP